MIVGFRNPKDGFLMFFVHGVHLIYDKLYVAHAESNVIVQGETRFFISLAICFGLRPVTRAFNIPLDTSSEYTAGM